METVKSSDKKEEISKKGLPVFIDLEVGSFDHRFGLIEINPETHERQWRRSGQLYSRICHTRSLTTQMAERYAPELLAMLFPG